MPPAIRPPVPSSSLIRFLRSQSEGFALSDPLYFTGCQARKLSKPTARCPPCVASSRSSACRRRPARPLSASTSIVRRHATMESGLLPLDALIPKFFRGATRRRPKTSTAAAAVVGGRQYSSDDCTPSILRKPSWHERIWRKSLSQERLLQPNEFPDEEPAGEFSTMFNARRLQTAKAALEPRLRCTEVDEEGKVILVDGEFKKSELIAKYGLLPRDLRKIDSSNLPHILVRPASILINLLHLKVLIKSDRVLLFDIYGSKTSYPQSAFMYDLQGRLQQKQAASAGGLPYEFRALEAVLMSVTSELESDFESVREPVIRVLSELEEDITREKLRILLVLSKKVTTFEQKAKLVGNAIEELLEADDDLAAMYLTEKTHDLYRGEDDHTEIEMLLESYHKITDEVVQEAGNLVSGIRNTEEIIRAILDANRNALMLLDLKFSVGTLGLAMGTFLAGLYGMNLENFIEETKWGFTGVTGMSMFFSLLVCWYGLGKLRKVQRVKMRGEYKTRDPHWFRDDGPTGLLEHKNRERLRQFNMSKTAVAPRRKWLGL